VDSLDTIYLAGLLLSMLLCNYTNHFIFQNLLVELLLNMMARFVQLTTHTDNKVEIADSLINNISFCKIHFIMAPRNFNVSAVLRNLKFYKMPEPAISITAKTFAAVEILIQNCTFASNQYGFKEFEDHQIVVIRTAGFNYTITFSNCVFYQNNNWESLIFVDSTYLQSVFNNDTCPTTHNIVVERCHFIDNRSPVLELLTDQNFVCNFNVIIIGPSSLIGNNAFNFHTYGYNRGHIYISKGKIKMIGPVRISNNITPTVIKCISCDMLFSKSIEFTSNVCDNSIISFYAGNSYLKVMEFSNISFTNNSFSNKAIALLPSDHNNPYKFCAFQYVMKTTVLFQLNITSSAFTITMPCLMLAKILVNPTSTI